MSKITRRDFIKFTGMGAAAAGFGAVGFSSAARAANGAHVVVVGGGFGGAACAKYLKRTDPSLKVTLIEANKQHLTCPFSNYVIAGWRPMNSLAQTYTGFAQKHGVDVVHDTVTAIDPAGRKVTLKGGKSVAYDRLVVAPGIELKWGAIKGYDEKAAQAMPHAWKAGQQTLLLQSKLRAMKNGGTVIVVAPANPFRCPPGPYERASVIAHYLKANKPKSKILILDSKDAFSKQALFTEGWNTLYPGMIEWVAAAKGGKVVAVDTKSMTVEGDIDKHKGDVVNVIPPQTAGKIALDAGLADGSGFCPVEPNTMESKVHKGIYVIGDSSIAGTMPKSGFSANSQAKMAAAAIATELRGGTPEDSSFVNTCYSLLAPNYGISIVGVYRATPEGIKDVPGSGGISPRGTDAEFRAQEARYALGWYASIVADTWA